MDKGFKGESAEPLRMHSENLDGSQSGEQSTSALDRDKTGRIGSGKNSPKSNNRSRSSSSNRSTGNFDASSPGRDLSALSKRKSGSITSLSSSSSSLVDRFQVEAGELIKPKTDGIAPSPGHDEYCPSRLRKEKEAVKVSSKAERDSESSSGAASTSPMSDITHESLHHSMSPTQSPAIQVMDRSGGYNPYRIPSTVFERSKPSTPVEWSIASNESLFSIHIGNNSFSRDHVTTPTTDLLKFDEPISISPPPLQEVASLDQIVNMDKTPAANTKSVEFTEAVQKENENNAHEETANSPMATWGSSCLSNESRMSAPSFSFPIKKKSSCPKPRWMRKMCVCRRKKCVWPSCYCSNCSLASCCRKWTCCFYKWPSCFCKWPSCHCCKWPSCSCKWPSCHCCKWPSCHCNCPSCHCPKCSCAFCYHWNCSRKRFCCCSSTMYDPLSSYLFVSHFTLTDCRTRRNRMLGDCISSLLLQRRLPARPPVIALVALAILAILAALAALAILAALAVLVTLAIVAVIFDSVAKFFAFLRVFCCS
ncbi:uncharacterized protein LOC125315074 [Rhodamnia argentea]|uniref:Uncharacterized protein LOC125315074 n=1 Tax=Rhodamnia argentea TaxID=178133 RepID=A0ABM3HEG7_9MYRT|nr:uncharacterized protein LOC125315074 [Rhodamnia argentea]